MSTPDPETIPGIVKNGVVVPQTRNPLPEGVWVEIVVNPASIPAKLRAELAQWDAASDEAWGMIDQWESESP